MFTYSPRITYSHSSGSILKYCKLLSVLMVLSSKILPGRLPYIPGGLSSPGYRADHWVSVLSLERPSSSIRREWCLYRLRYGNCPTAYVGQNGRKLGNRVSKHKKVLTNRRPEKSNFAAHLIENHMFPQFLKVDNNA